MSNTQSRRAGRTFFLCVVALIGLLGLAFFAVHRAADSPLILASGIVVALPIAAWIGGKAWASAMIALAEFAKR